jgi:hypothetical protein
MKVSIRAIAALALVALLAPAAAGAKEAQVNGPATLAGKGYFGGELAMSLADGQRPVKIAGQGGYVGFLDLGGDLKVRCSGRVQKTRTAEGTAYLCKGRGGQAAVLGSHFKFRGFARQYRAALPEGVRGTFHGRFVLCSPSCAADERPAQPTRPTREPAERKPAERTPAPRDDEEIPTVDALSQLLADQ